MYLAPILALRATMSADVSPALTRDVRRTALAFVGSLGLYVALRLVSAPLVIAAAVPALVMFAASPQLLRLPGQIMARLSTRRVKV
jgi:hypothetical protein